MADWDLRRRSRRPQARRAWLLLLMTVVLPGSAQLAHGRRSLGWFGLRLWGLVVAAALAAGVAFFAARSHLVALAASTWFLYALAAGVVFVAAVWLTLLADTWRMGQPRRLGTVGGLAYTVVCVLLAAALAAGAATAARNLVISGSSLSRILMEDGDTGDHHGRYNILLLGADSGPDRDGTRPDVVMVASVDVDTGRAVLFSLPRNLENVPFAAGSPLAKVYPSGFECPEDACMLNAVYLAGHEHADLYPGAADPGIAAMTDAVTGITGLAINYYVMVNMAGFSAVIDAVGGIDITVGRPVAVGAEGVVDYVIAPGAHHFNGDQALWFARTRVDSDDFDRMARQKCVVAAMVSQLNPRNIIDHFAELAQLSGNIIVTSVPRRALAELGELVLKTRSLPITSVSFTPPLISTGNPNFTLIRSTVQDEIARSEALDEAGGGETAPPPDPDPAGGDPTGEDPAAGEPDDPTANQVDDLQTVCSAGAR